MANFKNTEHLLAWIVDFFAIKFGNSAVLKGGMSLRLMHSPRYTNDVDYIFIPFDSKKDVKTLIEEALATVENLTFVTSLNSKAMRILVTYGGMQAQIEISAEKECPSIPMSSTLLSTPNGLPPRIVRIMEPSFSFSHKIAAWNERELLRDLYDIYQYESVFSVKPDLKTLENRLTNARSYANIQAAQDLDSLCEKLKSAAQNLSEISLQELAPILNAEELVGLSYRMRPAILTLCVKLQSGL